MDNISYGNQIVLKHEPVLLTADNVDIVSGFNCGVHNETDAEMEDFDCLDYLQSQAPYDREARTFIYLDQTSVPIAFFSLACSAIRNREESCGVKIETVLPSILIDKFFVRRDVRHLKFSPEVDKTLSEMIFLDVLERIEHLSDNVIGAKYAILYSTQRALHFYEKCGMLKFEEYRIKSEDPRISDCIPMYQLI